MPEEAVAEQKERDYEAEAKPLGWVPKEEYRGDPERWRDAKAFVEYGEQMMPILRDNFKTLKEEYRLTKKEVERLNATLQEFSQYHKQTADREQKKAEAKYQAEIKALKQAQAKAVKDGDVESYQNLETKREELEANKPEKPAETSGPTPEYTEWIADNHWYIEDEELKTKAELIAKIYIAEHPKAGNKSMFKHITKTIKELYPQKFENPKRNEAAAVGSGDGSNNTGGYIAKINRTYNDLPPDAKKACDMFVADKLLTREEYVKEYQWEA
jgi:hypothetical protein